MFSAFKFDILQYYNLWSTESSSLLSHQCRPRTIWVAWEQGLKINVSAWSSWCLVWPWEYSQLQRFTKGKVNSLINRAALFLYVCLSFFSGFILCFPAFSKKTTWKKSEIFMCCLCCIWRKTLKIRPLDFHLRFLSKCGRQYPCNASNSLPMLQDIY